MTCGLPIGANFGFTDGDTSEDRVIPGVEVLGSRGKMLARAALLVEGERDAAAVAVEVPILDSEPTLARVVLHDSRFVEPGIGDTIVLDVAGVAQFGIG